MSSTVMRGIERVNDTWTSIGPPRGRRVSDIPNVFTVPLSHVTRSAIHELGCKIHARITHIHIHASTRTRVYIRTQETRGALHVIF